MSLSSLLKLREVVAKFKLLRPKVPRKLIARLQIEPRTNQYALVGTAFDYLLRFELRRRAPHAASEPWVAESAPQLIDTASLGFEEIEIPTGLLLDIPLEEIAKRAYELVENAKMAVAAYVKQKSVNANKQTELAAHAIRLAKLDSVFRAGILPPDFEDANPEDVTDLVDMLAIVPFADLINKKQMYLNPTFEQSSRLVGGADIDMITGDMLVDFKTTKNNEIEARYLDQILGYLFLARRQHAIDSTFPVINRVGLYFGRHGYLWSLNASTWTSRPEFVEIEEWFFMYAKKNSC